MCLFRKCDETVIETKEYPSANKRVAAIGGRASGRGEMGLDALRRPILTTIKCNACGRVRIDQRSV